MRQRVRVSIRYQRPRNCLSRRSTVSILSVLGHTLARPYMVHFGRISDQQRGRVSFRLGRGCNPHILLCTDASSHPPSLLPFIPSLGSPPLPPPYDPSVGSRAIEPELKPYPFYTTEERTAITPRTNRRMALFNSKANKKFADRGWIRQEMQGGRKRERIKRGEKKNIGKGVFLGNLLRRAFAASVTAVLCKYRRPAFRGGRSR